MKYSPPQVNLAGSSIGTIQGQPDVSDPSSKTSCYADGNAEPVQYYLETASAYQADE